MSLQRESMSSLTVFSLPYASDESTKPSTFLRYVLSVQLCPVLLLLMSSAYFVRLMTNPMQNGKLQRMCAGSCRPCREGRRCVDTKVGVATRYVFLLSADTLSDSSP